MKRSVRCFLVPRRMIVAASALAITTTVVLAGSATTARAEHAFLYSDGVVTDLGVGGPVDINNAGQVLFRRSVYSGGAITDLPFEGSDINDVGQVVGSEMVQVAYPTASYWMSHAFLYSDGVVTDLGALDPTAWPFGRGHSIATALNDSGQVIGNWQAYSGGEIHAFLYSDGLTTDLGAVIPNVGFDLSFGGATAINHSGQVAGTWMPWWCYPQLGGHGCLHAFLYSDGVVTDLGALDPTAGFGGQGESIAIALNDAGQVVGYSAPTRGGEHAFLYSDGVMTDLGTLGGGWSHAVAISDSGQVIGNSRTADGEIHAFLYSGGVMTDLGALGGWRSEAVAINDAGQVVGVRLPAGCNYESECGQAFLYSDGVMTDLAIPGVKSSRAIAINNVGQIFGSMTPTPQPCDDGVACTVGDTIEDPFSGTICTGQPNDELCADDDPCTLDTCDRVLGCQHVIVVGPADGCSDGNPCTLDTCDAQGVCQHAIFTGPTDGCSDGNPCTLDTCDAQGVCQHAISTGPTDGCSDYNACTLDTCDELGVCQHVSMCDCPLEPLETCLDAGRSSLFVRDLADDTKDRITWRWGLGEEFVQEDLGDPQSDTAYSLCLYDIEQVPCSGIRCDRIDDFLVGGLRVVANVNWTDKNSHGWSYSDRTGAQDGVREMRLRTGGAGKTKVQLSAKGSNVPMPISDCGPGIFGVDCWGGPVTVQLFNDATLTCWTSAFTWETVGRNDETVFKAKW